MQCIYDNSEAENGFIEYLQGKYVTDKEGNVAKDENGDPKKILKVKATVSIDGPNGYHAEREFSEDTGLWVLCPIDLNPGTYTVSLKVDNMEAEGYQWKETVQAVTVGGETKYVDDEVITVNLEKNLTFAEINYIAKYEPVVEEKPEETSPTETTTPSGDSDDDAYEDDKKTMRNEIVIKAVDDRGRKLTGAKFELVGKREEPVPLEVDSKGVVQEDWEAYAEEGKQLNWVIQQSNTVDGHDATADKFSIQITKRNGSPKVKVSLAEGNLYERLLSSDKIKEGSEGETITYFENPRKKAEISVSNDVTVDVDKSCRDAAKTQKEFEQRTHRFVLNWKADNGKAQEEVLELKGDASGTFKAKLPFDTEYTLTLAGPYEFNSKINGKAATFIKDKVTVEQVKSGRFMVSANVDYEIIEGPDQDLYMTKVSSSTKKPLSGAKFELLDEDGNEMEDYITKKDGAVDIEDMFDDPGTYYLKEVKAPVGCIRLRKPIEIKMVIGYETKQTKGKVVLEQCLIPQIDNSSVELLSDGTYNIKNVMLSDNPKTGDSSCITIWIGILFISLTALSVIMAEEIKKRYKVQRFH